MLREEICSSPQKVKMYSLALKSSKGLYYWVEGGIMAYMWHFLNAVIWLTTAPAEILSSQLLNVQEPLLLIASGHCSPVSRGDVIISCFSSKWHGIKSVFSCKRFLVFEDESEETSKATIQFVDSTSLLVTKDESFNLVLILICVNIQGSWKFP